MNPPQKRHPEDNPSPSHDPKSLSRPISPPRKRVRETPTTAPSVTGSPWQLTWIQDLPEELNCDALTLKDLLGDPLISECWEFNYLHDIPFLMDAFDGDTRHMVNVHVVHGFWKQEDRNRMKLVDEASRFDNVQLHVAPMPEMFGTHHSKMMILFRHDETAQVIIHTANMISKDWTNMTNGIWKSPLLPKMSSPETGVQGSNDPASRSIGNRFKEDLMNYLKAYDRRRITLQPLVDSLRQHDFSAIKAALVASVPGTHNTHDDVQTKWGWPALQDWLRSVPCARGQETEIVVQVSSIATLGAKDEWLQKTLFSSLCQSSTDSGGGSGVPKLKVVFPAAEEIRRSLDGYASGGSIHTKIQSPQQAKQLDYMRRMFHHWANDCAEGQALPENAVRQDGGRGRAAPHIKTYIRYNGASIDWALLTSANLSKQAWGEASRKPSGDVRIASWEIGVLIWPNLIEKDSIMVPALRKDTPTLATPETRQRQATRIVGVRVPYSLPLQQYAIGEVPWVATMTHRQPDQFGRIWDMEG